MNEIEAPPEHDRAEGAPHPRETGRIHGQAAAERAFLEAFNSGRLHHGWLITGPRGVGKATLAWRIARFLLSRPAPGDAGGTSGGMFDDEPQAAQTLDLPADHPVARQVAALSAPGLFLLRPAWDPSKKRFKQGITVDEVRRLQGFFALSAADGGRRVVIVDCADDLNVNAANALLKMLEEPPDDATLLLVCHQPSRLLPTIRSRCRELRCAPLSADDLARAMTDAGTEQGDGDDAQALAELAGGSVGDAVRLANQEGLKLYAQIVGLFAALPQLDRQQSLKLAESVAGRDSQGRLDLMLRLFDQFLARLARTGASGPPLVEAAPGEAALMQRLCPTPAAARTWAELQQQLGARARHGRAVNLDPAALILDMVFKINETAAACAAR